MSEASQLNLILQMLWAKIGAKIFWLVTFSLLLVSRGELRKSWTRCRVEAESKWDWSFDSTSAFAALLSTNHAKCYPRTTVCKVLVKWSCSIYKYCRLSQRASLISSNWLTLHMHEYLRTLWRSKVQVKLTATQFWPMTWPQCTLKHYRIINNHFPNNLIIRAKQ